MKIKAVFAAALSAVILTGCAAVFDELDDGTYEEGTLNDETTSAVTDEKTSLSYGKGLEEITITAKEDPDPDRKIQRRRTPVRQMRGVVEAMQMQARNAAQQPPEETTDDIIANIIRPKGGKGGRK